MPCGKKHKDSVRGNTCVGDNGAGPGKAGGGVETHKCFTLSHGEQRGGLGSVPISRATVTKDHQLSVKTWLNRNVFSHSARGLKSEVKDLARPWSL